jgi:hypothetical protein
MNITSSFLAAISLLTLLCASANADVLQFQFSGSVSGIEAALAGQFVVGETIAGTFSVDTNNLSVTSGVGTYAASALSLTIGGDGGDYPVSGQAGELTILNNFGGSLDHFHLSFDGPLTGTAFNELTPFEFDLALSLPDTTLSSEAVPLSLPLDSLVGDQSSIDFGAADENTLDFAVTSLVSVPEPSLVALLGPGVPLLFASRRRTRIR